MAMALDNPFHGTDLKYLLEINASGFNMDTDFFEVELRRGAKTLVLHREDLPVETTTEIVDNITKDKNLYYVCFASDYFDPGLIEVKVTAHVPDDDFPNGIRRMVDKFKLANVQP